MKQSKPIRHPRTRTRPPASEIAFSFRGLRQAQITALHRPAEYLLETPVPLTYRGTPDFIDESIKQGTHAFSLRLRPPHRRPSRYVVRQEVLLQILNAIGTKSSPTAKAVLPRNIRFKVAE